jgi:hypothetical protein
MHLQRGLFRVWIAISVLWMIFATWASWKVLFVPATKLCTAADIAGDGPCHSATTSDRLYALETIVAPPIALIALGFGAFWLVRWVGRGFRSL